jgi:hypothetical protein
VPKGRLGHTRICAAPDDDTNASFRTESQSLPQRARNGSEWPDKLIREAHRRNSTTAQRAGPRCASSPAIDRLSVRLPFPTPFPRGHATCRNGSPCKVVGFDFRLKRIGDFVMAERRR